MARVYIHLKSCTCISENSALLASLDVSEGGYACQPLHSYVPQWNLAYPAMGISSWPQLPELHSRCKSLSYWLGNLIRKRLGERKGGQPQDRLSVILGTSHGES